MIYSDCITYGGEVTDPEQQKIMRALQAHLRDTQKGLGYVTMSDVMKELLTVWWMHNNPLEDEP